MDYSWWCCADILRQLLLWCRCESFGLRCNARVRWHVWLCGVAESGMCHCRPDKESSWSLGLVFLSRRPCFFYVFLLLSSVVHHTERLTNTSRLQARTPSTQRSACPQTTNRSIINNHSTLHISLCVLPYVHVSYVIYFIHGLLLHVPPTPPRPPRNIYLGHLFN